MNSASLRKVLLIGWDAADWKTIHPLMDQQKMPAMDWLTSGGTIGNLTTIQPVLSPMLWTSIGTGKRPFKHGVHGFTEPDPDGDGIRPVSSLSRSCKAIWNILNQNSLRSNVIGWWPSHPVEPINGVMVSNHFHKAVDTVEQPWTLDPSSVHPERLHEALADIRIHPGELVAEQLLPFVPAAATRENVDDPRIGVLAKILAECSTIQAVATRLISDEPWDFMAVYFDAIDHFSHGFMKYHPPQQEGISDEDFELYGSVIEGAYRFHDMMLQRLIASIDDETTVIVISDHGFHPDHLRPRQIPQEPAGPAIEHRNQGIFAMKGPGIKADHLIHGASILDITPTVLALFGLPIGQDMDGQPLVDAWVDPPSIEFISSWEDVPGESGMHQVDQQLNPTESRQAIDQLVALGYVERPSDDVKEAIRMTVREAQYNLAQSYVDAGQFGNAIPIYERLWDDFPDQHRFGIRLAACFQAMDRTEDQRRVAELLLERRRREAAEARAALDEFETRLRKEALDSVAEESTKREHEDDAAKEDPKVRQLTAAETAEYRRLQSLANFNPFFLEYLMGSVCHAEGKFEEALEHLRRAESADPRAISLHNLLGDVFLEMNRLDDADRSFGKVLATDPDNSRAHLGSARVMLERGKNVQAATEALTAIGLNYHFPLAHFVLGVALDRADRIPQAIDAFETTLIQNPGFVRAHKYLARIYENRLGEPDRAADHRQAAETIVRQRLSAKLDEEHPAEDAVSPDANADTASGEHASLAEDHQCVTIVSGLPRSGTSMMMQMLNVGGMVILADDDRPSDDDNPKGYFEFAPVRNLRDDASWIGQARGKAVKIVAPLLPYLPDKTRYRIILMERDLDEILASQNVMLGRRAEAGATVSDEQLKKVFQKQLTRIKDQLGHRNDVEVLRVDYHATIEDPAEAAHRVDDFLGNILDCDRMAEAVDRALYRQRS